MLIRTKQGDDIYDFSKALAIRLGTDAKKNPSEDPGLLYDIRLYFDSLSLKDSVLLAAYEEKEVARNILGQFIDAAGKRAEVFSFFEGDDASYDLIEKTLEL